MVAGPASASQLIAQNARKVELGVSRNGVAQISYTARGRSYKVLAWGGLNAVLPRRTSAQSLFRVNYANGWGTPLARMGRRFVSECRPYTGPRVAWFVAGCTAPDGSWWVLQRWRRMLPNYGRRPRGLQRAGELRLSHFTGALPVLEVHRDWSWHGRYDHLYGRATYRSRPLHGFRTTSFGAPLDKFGTLLYVDTLHSAYGRGWRRENAFVTHRPTGIWCYSVNPHGRHPAGKGRRYRITMQSPGALPDIRWQGRSIGGYNRARDRRANAQQRARFSDRLCRPN